MAAALDTVVAYYASKLALQYRTLPKATATISILAKQAVADFFAEDIQNAYDLETAVGAQLDVLAKYIGVSRNSNIPTTAQFFGYALVAGGGSVNGYNSAVDPATNGFLYERVYASSLPETAFTDEQFQFVLSLQIALNHFDGTLAYIQQMLADYFGGQVTVTDNLNMSLTYSVPDNFPISATVLASFLPRPIGCGISIDVRNAVYTRITSLGDTRVLSDTTTIRITG